MTSQSAQTTQGSTSKNGGQSSVATVCYASEHTTATVQPPETGTGTQTTASNPQEPRPIPYLPAEVMDAIRDNISNPVDKENFIKAYRPSDKRA